MIHPPTAVCRAVTASLFTLFAANIQAAETAEVPLDHFYGFQTLEILKTSDRAHSIVPGDFNSDGRTDIAVVDNSKNHIAIFVQREKADDPVERLATAQVNELDEPWRFEVRKLPADREVQALCTADFNSDGRADLAQFGAPDRLLIRYQPKDGPWKETREFRLPEVEARPWSIAGGDLNGDKLDDLVVLGKNSTYLLLQKKEENKDGVMEAPITLRNTSPGLGLAMISDLNGDGRNDLFSLATDDQKQPFCIRLQNDQKKLGPEMRFRLEEPRGVVLYNMDGKPGSELLAIDSQTNRLRMFTIEQKAEESEKLGRIVQYGFGAADSADRDVDVGDVNGDGAPDVAVTDPERAQVIVFLQKSKELDLGTAFPSFLGVSQIRLSDFDGDKSAEAAVLSSKENTVGVAKFENGRFAFPQTVGFANEVKVLETIDLNGDGKEEIVAVAKESQGRGRSGAKYTLSAMTRGDDGTWKAHPLADQPTLELDLKSDPVRLTKVDANQDGKSDLLLTFDGGKNPKLLVQGDGGKLTVIGESAGISLGEAKAGSVFTGELEKKVFLIAQGSFARSLSLDEKGRWQVLDQFNAGEVNSKVEAVATLDIDGEKGNEVVLIDTGVNKIRVFKKSDTGYTAWKEIELASFPYRNLKVSDLNGDGRVDLLLAGQGRFAVLYAGQAQQKLQELATFESKLKDVFMIDLVAGDLNGDGKPDAAVFDARTNIIEVLAYSNEKGLQHALQFKIFESKSFQGRGESGFQPREGIIADVTGDGRGDLLLLAHDRLLIYPQDPGDPAQATAAQ